MSTLTGSSVPHCRTCLESERCGPTCEVRAVAPRASLAERLSNLRAGVLGANDGIVSTAGLVVGVAGATSDANALVVAGVAGLVGGALSMAAGEYVSVSSARASQRALSERARSRSSRTDDLDTVAAYHRARGLSSATARQVAEELLEHDPTSALLEAEHGGGYDDEASPWGAATTSMVAFALGALLPLLAILLSPSPVQLAVTVATVTLALVLTGAVSARLGSAPVVPGVARNVLGGLLAMLVTYGIGSLLGSWFGW